MRKDILIVLIVLSIGFFFWKHIPALQIQGEGFAYFDESSYSLRIRPYRIMPDLTNLGSSVDILGRITLHILSRVFDDQIPLYMWFLFIYILITDVAVYILTKILTNSRLTAFLATLLFTISFIGKFDMFSIGGYQYFIQRGMLLLPEIVSFILFFIALKYLSIKYYLVSLTLYLLTIQGGYFGTWFLPIFIFYPLFLAVSYLKKNYQTLFKIILSPVPFILGNFWIISDSEFVTRHEPVISFLQKLPFVISAVFQQLSVITLPILWSTDFFKLMYKFFYTPKEQVLLSAQWATVIIYPMALLLIWKLRPKMFILGLSFLTSFLAMLVFNVFMNTTETLNNFSSSRYFYFPFLSFSVFWGIALSIIASARKFLIRVLLIVFLLMWSFYNYQLIQIKTIEQKPHHLANREVLKIMKDLSPTLKKEASWIFISGNLGSYGTLFVHRFYTHPWTYINFLQPDYDYLVKNNVDPEKLYVLRYDPVLEKLVDETDKSREILRNLKGVNIQ